MMKESTMRDGRTMSLFAPKRSTVCTKTSFDLLRWYQQDAVVSIEASLVKYRSTMLVLATGLGKTQVFSVVAHRWKQGRVLVLAHRDELVTQARDRLEQMTGELVEIEQAQLHSHRARIVVGSVQSVYRPDRLERLRKNGEFGLVIIDEAHHAVSATYQSVLEAFPQAKVLGVTATPDRADEKALGKVFDDVAYQMDLRAGIDHGYLVPVRGKAVEIKEIDLDLVRTSGDDLSVEQLNAKTLPGVEGIVKGMLHHSGTKQGILFFPGVECAELAAERLNAIRPNSAAFVSGATPTDERRRVMDQFKAGEIQFLSNCMVATEGFDAPTAAVIGLARPTKSRSLYAQMVGRGTRVLTGVVESIKGQEGDEQRRAAIASSDKGGCLIVDFVGNNTRHALVSSYDLLGGDYTEAERKRAKKIAEECEVDVKTALERAREQLQKEEERKARQAALAQVQSRVKSVAHDFNPFRKGAAGPARDEKYKVEYGFKPISPRQRQYLIQNGFAESEVTGMSARTATRTIDSLMARKKRGGLSERQARELSRAGIDTRNVTARAASILIKQILKGDPDPGVIRALTSDHEGF
jgi:superfamily II DNA or RNA helicase